MIFFIKIDTMIMLITTLKQIILISNFNFDEKSLICFKKFNKKDHITSVFQTSGPNWNKKKINGPIWYF